MEREYRGAVVDAQGRLSGRPALCLSSDSWHKRMCAGVTATENSPKDRGVRFKDIFRHLYGV